MKILLYSEGKNLFGKSGVGKALSHQRRALGLNDVEYTLDEKDDYDIAHINTIGLKSLGVLKKTQKMNKPVIYHTHTTYEDFKGSIKFSNELAFFIKKMTTHLYNKADYLISPSEYTKNLIKNKYLKKEKEVRVISNGVDTEIFCKKVDQKNTFFEKYNINENDKIIMTAGLPFERKGILDFIKVAEKFPNYKFFWFGASSIKSVLPKRIKNVIDNPPKNMMFPGFVEEEILIDAFRSASLFLFMSYEENEGIVILESLSTGLPILLRDIPVYENWLEDEKDCFKASNQDEFINKIDEIFTMNNSKINAIIENGYKVVQERNLNNIGKKYKEYYEYILDNHKK